MSVKVVSANVSFAISADPNAAKPNTSPGSIGRRATGALLLFAAATWATALRDGRAAAQSLPNRPAAGVAGGDDEMVWIPAGTFLMGKDDAPTSDAQPAHRLDVDGFWLDAHEVTNGAFRRFVEATGYVTTAETSGWAPVFDRRLNRWRRTEGANWRHPAGEDSTILGRDDYPVVQVSWYDANAFARHVGKRLPTEAEWERAARADRRQLDFAWGDEEIPDGVYQANYWQGRFPELDQGRDGFRGPAPVRSFPPHAKLYDLVGNVWEWCADDYLADYYSRSPRENPLARDDSSERVLRGGSWQSAANHQPGYHVWYRGHDQASAHYEHVGFRCARSGTAADAPTQ